MMHLRNFCFPALNPARPFAEQGVSVYVGSSLPLQYRNRYCNADRFFPFVRPRNISVTTRVDSAAGIAGETPELSVDLSAFAPGTVYVDVRHYRDGIENEATHPQRVDLAEDGSVIHAILGLAQLASVERRSGGVLRITIFWLAAEEGLHPEQFELIRTAGPSSPETVTRLATATGPIVFDTPALLDSDTYDFQVDAVIPAVLNDDDEVIVAEVRRTVLNLSDLQADASGPAAIFGLTLEVV
ncbi:hypothetical protein SH661x_000432 [Planctomicrobium sp. SH661]|uniref:hypothetical protein n=1 Tax=Planctomicrobium sp. SH661 TaxID=3448124 RepID=UPI003F5C0DB9